jgi:hypothetical protein
MADVAASQDVVNKIREVRCRFRLSRWLMCLCFHRACSGFVMRVVKSFRVGFSWWFFGSGRESEPGGFVACACSVRSLIRRSE